MPDSVTIQMLPEGPFRSAVAALPATDPLSRLGSVERVYIQDLGLRELDTVSRKSQHQAVYMEHWDGVSPSVDISVVLDGAAGGLNRGRLRFRYTDEVARSLERGFLKKVTDAGLFLVEGFDCECDIVDGIPTEEFVLRDGSRSFTGTIEGISPILPDELATKAYVDATVTGGGALIIEFDYTTPSPLSLLTIASGDVVDEVEVVIREAFNDAAASLRVGTVADPDLIFSSSQIDPTVVAQFRCPGNFQFTGPETLRLLISPGTSTQGSGYIVVKLQNPTP